MPPEKSSELWEENRISVGSPRTIRTFSFVVVIDAPGSWTVAVARVLPVGERDGLGNFLDFFVQVDVPLEEVEELSPSFLGRLNVAVEGCGTSITESMAPLDIVEYPSSFGGRAAAGTGGPLRLGSEFGRNLILFSIISGVESFLALDERRQELLGVGIPLGVVDADGDGPLELEDFLTGSRLFGLPIAVFGGCVVEEVVVLGRKNGIRHSVWIAGDVEKRGLLGTGGVERGAGGFFRSK